MVWGLTGGARGVYSVDWDRVQLISEPRQVSHRRVCRLCCWQLSDGVGARVRLGAAHWQALVPEIFGCMAVMHATSGLSLCAQSFTYRQISRKLIFGKPYRLTVRKYSLQTKIKGRWGDYILQALRSVSPILYIAHDITRPETL